MPSNVAAASGRDRLNLDRLRDGFDRLRWLEGSHLDTAGVRQTRVTREEAVDLGGARATFVDTPWSVKRIVSACKRQICARNHSQTMSDCPRRQSPAAKTPSAFVAYLPAGVLRFERASCSSSSALMAEASGPRKPSARRTRSAGKNSSEPGTSLMRHAPIASFSHCTRTVLRPLRTPFSSRSNDLVEIEYSRGSLPKWAATSCRMRGNLVSSLSGDVLLGHELTLWP